MRIPHIIPGVTGVTVGVAIAAGAISPFSMGVMAGLFTAKIVDRYMNTPKGPLELKEVFSKKEMKKLNEISEEIVKVRTDLASRVEALEMALARSERSLNPFSETMNNFVIDNLYVEIESLTDALKALRAEQFALLHKPGNRSIKATILSSLTVGIAVATGIISPLAMGCAVGGAAAYYTHKAMSFKVLPQEEVDERLAALPQEITQAAAELKAATSKVDNLDELQKLAEKVTVLSQEQAALKAGPSFFTSFFQENSAVAAAAA